MNKNMHLMLIGKTGHGKSSVGNSILMKPHHFVASDRDISCSKKAAVGESFIGDINLTVIDTPGVCDTHNKPDANALVLDSLREAMQKCPGGVDSFLYVVSSAAPRFTKEDESTHLTLKSIFSEEMFENFCIVVITHSDILDNTEEWIKSRAGGLKSLLTDCQHRYVFFNNRQPNAEQREALVKMVKEIRAKSGFYTDAEFERAKAEQDKLIEKEYYMKIAPTTKKTFSRLRDMSSGVISKTHESRLSFLNKFHKPCEDYPTDLYYDLEDFNKKMDTHLKEDYECDSFVHILYMDVIIEKARTELNGLKSEKNTSGVFNELINTVEYIIFSQEKEWHDKQAYIMNQRSGNIGRRVINILTVYCRMSAKATATRNIFAAASVASGVAKAIASTYAAITAAAATTAAHVAAAVGLAIATRIAITKEDDIENERKIIQSQATKLQERIWETDRALRAITDMTRELSM